MKKTLFIIPLFLILPLSAFALTPPPSIVCSPDDYGGTTYFYLANINSGGIILYGTASTYNPDGSAISVGEGCPLNLFGISAGGIFSKTTTTGLLAAIGEVSSPVFTAVFPYLMLSAGVFIAFLIAQKLLFVLYFDKRKHKK